MGAMSGWARLWAALAGVLALFLAVTVGLVLAGERPAGTSAAVAAEDATTIAVTLTEFGIAPAPLTAPAATPLRFEVTNEGTIEHDFVIEGVDGTELIPAGETRTLEVAALDPGEYQVLCSVAGHAEAGMQTTLTVEGGAASGHDTGADAAQGDHGDPAEMAAKHDGVVAEFPAETEGEGNVPLEPQIAGDGTKVFELTASEIEWEVAPGDVKTAYAYNGMVPGPRIDVDLGDRVRVVLHNELPVPTALHLHGLVLPNEMDGVPGLTQSSVLPGESFTYEFEVRNAGSHMYHSHFDSANQVPGGLLGAFIVHGPDEPEVDHDLVMILNDGPLGYTLNGKGFPATAPLVMQQGETARVRYMNEGLQIHPMHLHGLPQQVIANDGYPLPQPHTEDNVLVAPGDRIDVLVEASELGAWAWHCHILSHAEGPDGMFGMVTAVIVEE